MFAKVFKSIYYGSLMGMKNARDVFICLLTHADRHGMVEYVTEEMIAGLVGITVEEVREAVAVLEAPDPRTRTPNEDGRRLRRLIPNGWEIVNYVKYREMRDEDSRREQTRAAQKVRRSRLAGCKPEVSQESSTRQPLSTHAEVDVEVEVDAEAGGTARPSPPAVFVVFPTVGDWNDAPIFAWEVERWAGQFPAVDVKSEIGKMHAWLEANPTRRKTARGVRRFIVGWLSKEQDRGRANGVPVKAPEAAARGVDPQKEKYRQWKDDWEREQREGVKDGRVGDAAVEHPGREHQ